MRLQVLSDQLADRLSREGRGRTADAYRSAYNSVAALFGADVTTEEFFRPENIHRYQEELLRTSHCRNTVSFYMRMLRTINNKGVELKATKSSPGLFKGVFTGTEETAKRALSAATARRITSLNLPSRPEWRYVSLLFLASLLLQGMSFVDMAFLRMVDWQGDIVKYRRSKTNTYITIRLTPEARAVLEELHSMVTDPTSPYVLPIIKQVGVDEELQYKSALRNFNRKLSEISDYLGLEEKVTSYSARHTWATVAYLNGVDIRVISQCMGHRTEAMTRVYLASFGYVEVLEANETVLRAMQMAGQEPVLETQEVVDLQGIVGLSEASDKEHARANAMEEAERGEEATPAVEPKAPQRKKRSKRKQSQNTVNQNSKRKGNKKNRRKKGKGKRACPSPQR